MRIASKRVVLGAGENLSIEPACITLGEPLIESVQPLEAGDYEASLSKLGGEVVDYGDKLVTPAFINAHTHLALGFLRGFDLRDATRGNMVEEFFYAIEGALSPDDIAAFVRMGAYESLLQGVGLVWDHYYGGEHVAAALADVGLGGVVAPTLQDIAGPGKDAWEAQLDATQRIDDNLGLRSQGIFAALGPHATDTVSEELWLRALKIADERKLPLHAHLAQSPEEYRRAQRRHGVSPAEWMQQLGVFEAVPSALWAHVIYASESDLELLAGGNNTLVWCPFSAMVFGFPARVDRWTKVNWAVATDCSSTNDGMNVQAELRLIAGQRTIGTSWSAAYEKILAGDPDAVVEAWQHRSDQYDSFDALTTPASMLSRVWSIPGKAHPAFTAGVLEKGALANIVVWDLDHPSMWPALDPLHTLAMADSTKAMHAMFVSGRRMGNDGEVFQSIVRSDAYRGARHEATTRLAALLQRVSEA
jgi:5-methylthioadenosine/S-adenosylhomocysteine deaminase